MNKRWFIWLTIAALSVSASACNIKNIREESVSPTGYPAGEVQRASVSYHGALYLYTGDGFDLPLREGYTKAGTVERVNNLEYPTTDFQGTRLETGQELYANPADPSTIYLKYDSGYAPFKRESEKESQPDRPAPNDTVDTIWTLPEAFTGTWQLDGEKTAEHLKNSDSLSELFGTGLGTYGASVEINADGSFHYFIGIGIGGTGQCEADGEGIRVPVSPYQDHGGEEGLLRLRIATEQGTEYLIMEYGTEHLYWIPDTEGEQYFEKDGIRYEKVPDLVDGICHWASALTEGEAKKDDHGHDTVDYQSQKRTFVCLDNGKELGVRRWDNLCGSAGDYLIYEYDGITHVAKSDDLYHPVFSGSSFRNMVAVPDGYMIANGLTSAEETLETVGLYDKDFRLIRMLEGYRATEIDFSYQNGLLPVRNMETGLMGFIDQQCSLAIPCEYGYADQFSNGYASVLVGADMIPYTEDSGTVPMFDAKGGQWGILDTHGTFVVEASERFANLSPDNPDANCYCGPRRFSPVRTDGTTDFIALDENEKVIETIQIPNFQ